MSGSNFHAFSDWQVQKCLFITLPGISVNPDITIHLAKTDDADLGIRTQGNGEQTGQGYEPKLAESVRFVCHTHLPKVPLKQLEHYLATLVAHYLAEQKESVCWQTSETGLGSAVLGS
jgi:hypothetical protein